MITTCKLLTVAAMLLHSIFGCSLHHACACGPHEHVEHRQVAEMEDAGSCEHDHDGHHHRDACHDEHQCADNEPLLDSWLSRACDSCEGTPIEQSDKPCCSDVQCSFILASDVEFSVDKGPTLGAIADFAVSFAGLHGARKLAHIGRVPTGVDDSLSRCALHCSWQI